jgi:hypothetical protein
MRTVIDLTDLDRHFRIADTLLVKLTDTSCLRTATACLEEVDAVLAELVADDDVTNDVATKLGRVRDGLSGHLEAAAAMRDLDLPDYTVAGMLQRGVSVARTGIEAINATSSQPDW